MSADVEDIYPLLPGQLGMVLRTVRSPDSGAYIEQRTCTIEGRLDVDLVRAAWRILVSHHPALRTTVHWEGLEHPVQVVHATTEPEIRVLDGGLDRRELTRLDAREGFELDRPPLHRVTVLREATDRWYVMWTAHHVILDGWSANVVLQEFFALYDDLTHGRTPQAVERPHPREAVRAVLERDPAPARTFWLEHLAGAGTPEPIRVASAHGTHSFERIDRPLPRDVDDAVRAFAREQQVTSAAVYFAAWQWLLARYTGTGEVVTGVVTSGRNASFVGAEQVVGLLLNTLPARTTVREEVIPAELVRHCHDVLSTCAEHDQISLVTLHEWARRPATKPWFQSLFVTQNFPFDARMLQARDDWKIGDVDFVETTDVPLSMMIVPPGRVGVDGVVYLSYDAAYVPASAAPSLVDDYRRALAQLVDNDAAVPAPAGSPELALALLPAAPRPLEASPPHAGTTADAPLGTQTEQVLAALWTELLGVRVTSGAADFFAAGGQSLTAMRVVSTVRERLGVALPLEDVFEFPGLADCAARIDGIRDATSDPVREAEPVASHRGRPGYLLSPAQQRLWFLEELHPRSPAYLVSAAVQVKGRLQEDLLRRAVDTLLVRHETLRTLFPDVDGTPVAVVDPAAEVRWSVDDVPAAELPEVLTAQARTPFDLRSEPPMRVWVLRVTSTSTVVHLGLHHIIADEWSLAVILRELVEIYETAAEGRPPQLPALPRRFVDYARHLRDRRATDDDLAHWRHALRDIVSDVGLPERLPRPRTPTFRGGRVPFTLGEQDVKRLRHTAEQRGTTLFTLLSTAVAVVLSARSGHRRFALGTPVAQRPDVAVENLVGLLIDTVPIPVEVDPTVASSDLVDRVAAAVVAAIAHAHVGFDAIVEALPASRAGSTNPLFTVLVALHEMLPDRYVMHDLDLRPLEVDGGGTQFDLSVRLRMNGDTARGTVEYAIDLYRDGDATRFAAAIETVLRELPDRLDESVSALALVADPMPGAVSGKPPVNDLAAPGMTPESTEPTVKVPAAAVRDAWRSVLGVDDIREGDDFYALGGDSISLVRVRSRLAAAGHDVPLQALYAHPVFGDLVWSAGQQRVAAVSPTGTQQQMLDQSEREREDATFVLSADYDIDHPYEPAVLRVALEEATARHPALRTGFRRDPLGVWTQEVTDRLAPRLTTLRLETARYDEWWATERCRPFDVSEPGLVRWFLVGLSDGGVRFGVVAHHAIVDGMSLAALLRAVFERCKTGRPESSPVGADTSFPAFVESAQPERRLPESLPFWRTELASAVPQRVPRIADSSDGGRAEPVEHALGPDLARRIAELARHEHVSERLLLLAAHIAVHTDPPARGTPFVATGVVMHGRTADVPDDAVGNHLNVVPLVLRDRPDTWLELLRAVQSAEAGVTPHLGCPFPDVERALGIGTPFDALFNYVHFHRAVPVDRSLPVRLRSGREPFPHPVAAHFRRDPVSNRIVLALHTRAACLPTLRRDHLVGEYVDAMTRLVESPEGTCW